MILRDVTYSDQHRLLSGTEAALLRPTVTEVISEPAIDAPSLELKVRPEPPLTLQRVLAWLDTLSAESRIDFASHLDAEIDSLRVRAVEEGKAVGARVAAQEVEAQFSSIFSVLKTMAQEADVMFTHQRDELVKMCVAVVDEALAKLLGAELRDPGVSMGAVRQAVAHLCGSHDVTIRVHVNELDVIASKRAEIAEALGDDTFKLVADPRVSIGGCLVESSFGEIDARWESQLSAMIKTLRDPNTTGSERS